jgi:hypothetical protein
VTFNFATTHLSDFGFGVLALCLAPVWFFVFYPAMEHLGKSIGRPYKFSIVQKGLPSAFLLVAGLVSITR